MYVKPHVCCGYVTMDVYLRMLHHSKDKKNNNNNKIKMENGRLLQELQEFNAKGAEVTNI